MAAGDFCRQTPCRDCLGLFPLLIIVSSFDAMVLIGIGTCRLIGASSSIENYWAYTAKKRPRVAPSGHSTLFLITLHCP